MPDTSLSQQLAARLSELYPAHEWGAETREDGEYVLLEFLEARATVNGEGAVPDALISELGAMMIKSVSEGHEIAAAFWRNKIDGDPTGKPIGILKAGEYNA